MKFLHLGDLHLGKNLGDYDLIEDQRYILEQILNIIKEEGVKALLIAGDVYDKTVPSEAATNLLDEFLSKLAYEEVNVFMISGNHDSDDRLNFGSSIFEAKKVFIAGRFKGELYRKTLTDEYGDINVFLLPFVKASQVKRYYPEDIIENYDDAVRRVVKGASINKSERNIIVAHQFVAGKNSDPKPGGSEGASVTSVGMVEKTGWDIFSDFDYTALGHIHSPQSVGEDNIRYSGSPLKYSLSEVNNNKSVPLIDIREKGQMEIRLIPLKPLRDLRHIKGELKTLLKKENVVDKEDFIYVTLTDEELINDAMGIIRQVYKNTVKIDYDNSHTRGINAEDVIELSRGRSFTELISDFYKLMYGCEISDDEYKAISEAAKEVGVLNETD